MAAAQPQGGQGDNSTGILWGIAAIFVAAFGAWFLFRKYIVLFYLTIKLYEIQLVNTLSNNRLIDLYQKTLVYLAQPDKVVFADMMAIGDGVGTWLRIPLALLMFILAVLVYLSNTTRVFKTVYTMRQFASLEKANWPQISPVLELDLLKTNIDVGPWAMALTPMNFCKRYKLLEEIRPSGHESFGRKDRVRIEVVLKKGEANKLFALQLGQQWQGVDRLASHAKALFAVFAARINADTKAATHLLNQLSSSSVNKLDLSGVDDLVKKHLPTPIVQHIINSYAYNYTVMAAMLEAAREDGVQASADFLWLKPLDRKLWYTLNMVGRQTPYVEVAGIFAHWIAEKEAGRRLIVPMIEEATKALEVALKEVIYRPDSTK